MLCLYCVTIQIQYFPLALRCQQTLEKFCNEVLQHEREREREIESKKCKCNIRDLSQKFSYGIKLNKHQNLFLAAKNTPTLKNTTLSNYVMFIACK